MPEATRPLRVFLCHAKEDKPTVRDLYRQLAAEGWMDVWLDEQKLLPGQEWDIEIEKAVEQTDVVLVCLSTHSVDKEGYVQKELRFVLNIADEKPEGTIFVIPLRLDDCQVPRRLRAWQWVDYFPKNNRSWAYQRLLESLKLRAARLGISTMSLVEEKARRAAEERARKEAEEQLRKEKEQQDRKAAEERARKMAEQPAPVGRDGIPTYKDDAIPSYEKTRKTNFVPFVIGAGLLVLVCGIFGGNYIFQNVFAKDTPIPTDRPRVSTPTSAPTRIVPTNTITQPAPSAVPTLGIGSTMISPKDGMTLLYVPAGEFVMGNKAEDALAVCKKTRSGCQLGWFKDEEPPHNVSLDSFWIDQTEVTNAMYAKCVKDGICNPPSSTVSNTRSSYYGNPVFDNYPVIFVSWNDATAYCSWAERRLPTEAEWEKAASWDEKKQQKYVYPWGNSIDCSLANYDESKDGGCIGDTTSVGSYARGQSPYGVLDMAGNVDEWVVDWYSETYYSISPASNPSGPNSGQYRVHRGGTWNNLDYGVRSADRGALGPAIFNFYFGFRCARSP